MTLTDQLRDSLADKLSPLLAERKRMNVKIHNALSAIYEELEGRPMPHQVTFYDEEGRHWLIEVRAELRLIEKGLGDADDHS